MRKIKANYDRKNFLKADVYLFVLAHNNLELAQYVNDCCDDFTKLDLVDIYEDEFSLNADDMLFYESGGKFNDASISLYRGESWGKKEDRPQLSSLTSGYIAAMAIKGLGNDCDLSTLL